MTAAKGTHRRFIAVLMMAALVLAGALALAGCSPRNAETAGSGGAETTGATEATAPAQGGDQAATPAETASGTQTAGQPAAGAKSIVVYFSHTGENHNVGVIDEGNTAIIAKMIAEKTGSDIYEIVPAVAYPEGYDECCDVALEEQRTAARPAIAGELPNLAGYDTVYFGYPIWWGDLPMISYTFIEGQDWSGKTIRPFCTHEGSGLSGTEQDLQAACPGATVAEGLAVKGTVAQNERTEAEAAVDAWL